MLKRRPTGDGDGVALWLARLPLLLPLLVLVAGVVASGAGAWWQHSRTVKEAEAEFQRIVLRESAQITERFRAPVNGLSGLRAMYATHPELRREDLQRFIANRNMQTEFPGVRGFGLVRRVQRDELPALIAEVRADGAPNFALRQMGEKDRAELFVVTQVEPAGRNSNVAGVDLASERVRREGVQMALETGEVTASGLVILSREGKARPGVLLFLPMYQPPANGSPDERGPLRGLVFAPIVLDELLAGLGDATSGHARIQLFDTASGTPQGALMFDSEIPGAGSGAGAASAAASASAGPTPRFEILRTVDLPGRMLTMRIQSTPMFEASYRSTGAWVLAGGGLLASLLLAALLRQQMTGRQRAEGLAGRMTAELGRLALVAQRTSNAVVITDVQRRITWVNDGFERITGYTASEVMGQSPGPLLQTEATSAATVLAIREALNAGLGFQGELLNRGKDGSVYWLEIDIQPIHDDGGALVGFMAVEADITARKQAERSLQRERRSLQNIIEGTQVGTWEWNVETGATVFNERWAQMLGYSLAELGPTTVSTWTDLAHPDDVRQSAVLLERHFDGLTPAYECEARMRHRDGHWVWVLDRGQLFSRSEDGRPRWMAGTRMDITERKQADTALRASQAFLAQTGRIGGVGGWELDLATNALRWSDETFHILEVEPGAQPTREEALAFYTPEARPVVLQAVADGIAGGPGWDLELPMVTARGRAIWVRAVGQAELVDGQPVRVAGAFQDITARRALEAELRAKNGLVNNVIENLPCGLSVFDGELKLVAANREFRRLLGFPDSLFEPAQVSFEDVIRFNAARGEYGPGDVEATVQAIVARARAPQQPHQFERTRPDGTPLEVRGAPMPGGGFVTTYTDISARKAAEAEVKRSAELMRGAIDAIDEAFVLYDPEDRLVYCNDKYRQIYAGVAHLMVTGARFEDIVRAGAEAGQYLEAIGRVEEWVAERVAVHLSGNSSLVQRLDSGRTLRIVERKLPDGHIVGFRIDITELMRSTQEAERATLEASRALARLQAIYDILPVGLTLTDKQGHIVDCNPASERLLGITKAEHLARSYDARDWNVLREDGTTMPSEEYASVRALTQQTAVHDAVMNVVTPQRSVWLSVSAMPVQHEELGVVVGYVDITEQRAQRSALLQAKAEAEQASVAKSQFLANMSHEIRTPMNAILGMLALLKRTELSARQADYTGKTEGAARSLLGLLNDILDFSKVEAGKMTLDPHPFRVDQVLRDLGVILSSNLGAKPVEVLFDIDPALPSLLVGDAMRLRQVLINLGGNAIKFTEAGEVVVSVRVVERQDAAVTLHIDVRDTGIGIAPENQARIFSGFTQAEASTTRRYGGTGLGVAISQRLVGLMGSELRLDSVLGRGSRFHFELTLPLAHDAPDALDAADADEQAEFPPRPAAQATLRALAIDDNATARELLQRMIESLGWQVDVAASGEAGLALLAAQHAAGQRYDAVFVDWQMPGLDGWETAQRIRAGGLAAEAPLVVMVTAHGRERLDQRSRAEQALLDGFLVKPVTASMLLDAITDARRAHQAPHLSAAGRPAPSTGAPRLAGLRLLVTEDNLNNQQVARELLEDEGAIVQIANNGQESVEAVAAADPPFDVVLMDLQMPVMDGFTATARIRSDLGCSQLPIVAMTANAMASDREACLAAGMNEHVGKPFDLDRLVAVLLRVSGRGAATAAAARPSATADEPPAALPAALQAAATAAGVDLAAALHRLGGKRPVYQRMLRGALKDFDALPAALHGQLAAGALADAARTLHTLKGTAATLGLAPLAAVAATAERALNTTPAPNAEAALQAVTEASAALASAVAPLLALLAQLQAADAAPSVSAAADPLLVQGLLQELCGLLDSFDMRATELLPALQQQAGSLAPAAMTELDEAVAALDFERAGALCRQLISTLDIRSTA